MFRKFNFGYSLCSTFENVQFFTVNFFYDRIMYWEGGGRGLNNKHKLAFSGLNNLSDLVTFKIIFLVKIHNTWQRFSYQPSNYAFIHHYTRYIWVTIFKTSRVVIVCHLRQNWKENVVSCLCKDIFFRGGHQVWMRKDNYKAYAMTWCLIIQKICSFHFRCKNYYDVSKNDNILWREILKKSFEIYWMIYDFFSD